MAIPTNPGRKEHGLATAPAAEALRQAAEHDIYRFVVRSRHPNDPRSAGLLADARALGMEAVQRLNCQDLYFIEGRLQPGEGARPAEASLLAQLFSDPITQSVDWGHLFYGEQPAASQPPGVHVIEVALRPGVTDPVAEQIVRSAGVLGIQGVQRACTGLRFEIEGTALTENDLHSLAKRLLANPIIQRYALGEIEPVFPQAAQASGRVERLSVRALDEAGLLALSQERRAALDLAEMQAIQYYYQREGRDPSDVEFETIAQTWSEHCGHKTFKARIAISYQLSAVSGCKKHRDEVEISNLLNTYIRAATETIGAPWVRSAFVDNAGIIDFDEQFEVSFKVETHNHPSAIEPFGGANTGVGGVIRDVLGVSARPIAATDVLCFGPPDLALEALPEGVLHPRRIRSGVVAGVQDYGNKIGIPTVNGAVLYDPGYTANPLVFCGCVGLAPKGSHPSQPQPGDRVIVLGGRTGRDGLRGATFSSMTMDGQTGEVSGASVQIGDPITEKGVIEVVMRARDLGLYHAITDCGAGGLSSAVGEMSSQSGAEVELQQVRLKYPGLAPWEIWLSEAQERMVLAVPPQNLEALAEHCAVYEVELTDIGSFTDTRRLVVRYAGQAILELDNHFLHHGIPQRQLQAAIPPAVRDAGVSPPAAIRQALELGSLDGVLLALLADPDIASKAPVIRIYDHEVRGATVIKPLTGALNDGPSDAAVLKPLEAGGAQGIVLSNGINPQYGKLDAYQMAWSVIDEAIRNAVAVGADPQRIALLDNFCWGDPKRPETLGSLVQAARGCHDAAVFYGTPFISGKDSLNNEYLGADGQRHAIPPTLLISAIGVIRDIRQTVTMDLKAPGNLVYLVGEHQPAWGGSHAGMLESRLQPEILPTPTPPPTPPQVSTPGEGGASVPSISWQAPQVYRALHRAIQAGVVRACHDLSEGGLAVAAAEMCIGGRLGLELELVSADPALALFGESNGCLLVEVNPANAPALEALFDELPIQRVGRVTQEQRLVILLAEYSRAANRRRIDLAVAGLAQAWNGGTR